MAARSIFAFLSLILVAGSIVLIFFVLLAGAINGNPVNQVYFLQADTSSIKGAPALSQWTLWNVCGSGANSLDANCGKISPAFPFDPQSNFGGSTQNVPQGFQGTNMFYLETRFMFAFVLITLFFAVCSFFLSLLALCSRIGSYLSAVMCLVALLFQTVAAALMTAAYVQGRNIFNSNNMTASLGRAAFGFMWGAMACLLLAAVSSCVGGGMSKRDSHSSYGRKKSTRSRGSFIDNDASSFRRA
ncbi:MAG: hypothetical protein LQ340_000136 [Diploschistes diacapsis]|nr:MAG: hypothetical protein LQ340_000136 [Diploschistes diacapsis]